MSIFNASRLAGITVLITGASGKEAVTPLSAPPPRLLTLSADPLISHDNRRNRQGDCTLIWMVLLVEVLKHPS